MYGDTPLLFAVLGCGVNRGAAEGVDENEENSDWADDDADVDVGRCDLDLSGRARMQMGL